MGFLWLSLALPSSGQVSLHVWQSLVLNVALWWGVKWDL